MKINAPVSLFGTFDRVRGGESAGDAPKRERGRDQKEKRDSEEPKNFEEASAQVQAEVVSAVDDFSHQESVTANGLQAEVTGQGPGLRVTLKDGRGALVRQFTGEEFLRLREAATGPSRGRLLDKKL